MEEKSCVCCGRRIEWRRKWKDCWDEIRFCSKACRRRGRGDPRLEASLLEMLDRRAAGASICPSEVARGCFGDEWREHMEEVRRAARRLVAAGEVEITQKGQVVDPSRAKGPIRIRKSH
jgi:hypothetical protein